MIQIRNVSDDLHRKLEARAACARAQNGFQGGGSRFRPSCPIERSEPDS